MRYRTGVAWFLLLACCAVAAGKDRKKDKKKFVLPADVLQAKTVLVVIDPTAGMAADAPNANRDAQMDVENALMKWGHFLLATDVSTAELVITVRRGYGKTVQPTIGGIPDNNRPVIFEPSDSGGRIGMSRGTPPMAGDPTAPRAPNPGPQVEVGSEEAVDTFAVYRGERDNPLESAPVWRYSAKDALRSPDVPAVEVFRKLMIESEKQQDAKP
jgi:hypothetical protein